MDAGAGDGAARLARLLRVYQRRARSHRREGIRRARHVQQYAKALCSVKRVDVYTLITL